MKYEELDLKVMSFNIRYQTDGDKGVRNWSNRRDAVAAFIASSGVDVICMQEVMPVQFDDLQAALSDKYELLFFGSNGAGTQANVIGFDKTKWMLKDSDIFWLSETPDVPSKGWGASHYRICCTATIVHRETYAEMRVFNVHLDHKESTEAARVNGIGLVLDRIALSDTPAYLCGDFNCDTSSDAYKNAAAVMNDSMARSPVTESGITYQNWGGSGQVLLDYNMFSKDDFELLSFDIREDKWGENNENYLSDHYAIESCVKMRYIPIERPDITGAYGTDGNGDDYTQRY